MGNLRQITYKARNLYNIFSEVGIEVLSGGCPNWINCLRMTGLMD
ncbi:21853_t:CDS:1, partial [Racocetra persica]